MSTPYKIITFYFLNIKLFYKQTTKDKCAQLYNIHLEYCSLNGINSVLIQQNILSLIIIVFRKKL